MSEKKPDIAIVCYTGCFEESELNLLADTAAQYDLTVSTYQRSPYVQASIDFFFPFIEIFLSPEIVGEIYRNAVSSGTYDAIKLLLGQIRNKFHKRPIYKVQSKGVTEETPNIQFRVGNNSLVLPVDVDFEKFKYVVDQFMECSSKDIPDVVTYSIYCEEDDSILRKTERDIISEELAKHQEKSYGE